MVLFILNLMENTYVEKIYMIPISMKSVYGNRKKYKNEYDINK